MRARAISDEKAKEIGGISAEDDWRQTSRLAGRDRQIPEELLQLARELRKEQTTAEQFLWNCLRDRKLNNFKFRRQHNLGPYIADFYCHAARLCIELDGGIHETPEQKERDQRRDQWLLENGFKQLRIQNDLMLNDPLVALRLIADALGTAQETFPEGEACTLSPEASALTPRPPLPKASALTPRPPLPRLPPSPPNPLSPGERGRKIGLSE